MIVCISIVVDARLMSRTWSYVQLRDESELIVIAIPVESITIDEKIELPDVKQVNKEGKESAVIVGGVETRFQILSVLKGDPKLKTFLLHHYREIDPPVANNRLYLVSFDPKQKKKYLMYLKKESNDRYLAVSGQTDPEIAIKEISSSATEP